MLYFINSWLVRIYVESSVETVILFLLVNDLLFSISSPHETLVAFTSYDYNGLVDSLTYIKWQIWRTLVLYV